MSNLLKCCVLSSLIVSCNAYGDLVKGNGFTTDTATGLDWLDITNTVDVSVQAVNAGYAGYLSAGWAFATQDQVNQLLWGNVGIPDVSQCLDNCNFSSGSVARTDLFTYTDPNKIAAESRLINDLGIKFNGLTYPGGFVNDYGEYSSLNGSSPSFPDFWVGWDRLTVTADKGEWQENPSGGIDALNSSEAQLSIGSFLVKADSISVPEPQTWSIFGLGVLVMGLVKVRRSWV